MITNTCHLEDSVCETSPIPTELCAVSPGAYEEDNCAPWTHFQIDGWHYFYACRILQFAKAFEKNDTMRRPWTCFVCAFLP